MMSVYIDTITTTERITQLHPNGGQWETQDTTLYLVQISGQSDFTIHFGIKNFGHQVNFNCCAYLV